MVTLHLLEASGMCSSKKQEVILTVCSFPPSPHAQPWNEPPEEKQPKEEAKLCLLPNPNSTTYPKKQMDRQTKEWVSPEMEQR
jgi:hypothetical protein